MAVQFHSPSYRASQSDLTVNISPLGLVEMADESFEVHGPRLNRYAHYQAMYTGVHWSHRRPTGDNHVQFNYCGAFTDYMTSFVFGRGVSFRVPKQNEGVIPRLLQRVWEVDNYKPTLLWDIGTNGAVTGDSFVKVAYEEPWVDSMGVLHEGRVRIIPLNSATVFPEWHPHDRERMTRVKIRYKFYGLSAEGTRQVFTWTEILTENSIEEYVNDERIDVRENPIGEIPVVHIPNLAVNGSPWGLSDLKDLVSLNREYNEKAEAVSDIINYHAEPTTIVTGAEANNLQRGAGNMWHGLPADAKVYNLQLDSNLGGPINYMQMLKAAMHEMTGIPESALGQSQAISNTSGVALQMQYMPLMNRRSRKIGQYAKGFKRINALVLRTLAIKEPQAFYFDPTVSSDLDEGQAPYLDPRDPLVYETEVDFPDPLPLDKFLKLRELQAMMEMGLESKRGAMSALGEEFPDEKIEEIISELREDVLEEGAINMLRADIQQAIIARYGMLPVEQDGGGTAQAQASGGEDQMDPGGTERPPGPGRPPSPVMGILGKHIADLTSEAYGVRSNVRANPETAMSSPNS